ncbi:MAG: prepilin-type N-terminal cleavage/methylation domain-containing protein [Pseudohongiellaceae bacterium]|nr:prepilin-type N-terminal cleavage/methylation domain-containing protein [Pseudohongiellaceae bacterium]
MIKYHKGLTLVEMIVAIIILAVALVGITRSITTGLSNSGNIIVETQAVALAQSYLDEILGKRFDDASSPRGIPPCRTNCTDEVDFGPELPEDERIEFDDVDDYHDLDEGWEQLTPLQDAEGNDREGYDNFRVHVTVRYLDLGVGEPEEGLGVDGDDLENEQDAKLITVTVFHPTNEDGWKFSVYKANF